MVRGLAGLEEEGEPAAVSGAGQHEVAGAQPRRPSMAASARVNEAGSGGDGEEPICGGVNSSLDV